MRKTIGALIVMGAMSLGLVNVLPAHADSGYATTAEINAEIAHIDPNHMVTWYPTLGTYGQGSNVDGVYGTALPWYNAILLDNAHLPENVYKAIIVHEWSHYIQFLATGATLLNMAPWQAFVSDMNALSGNQYGIEYVDECMVEAQGQSAAAFGGCIGPHQIKSKADDMLRIMCAMVVDLPCPAPQLIKVVIRQPSVAAHKVNPSHAKRPVARR